MTNVDRLYYLFFSVLLSGQT